MIKDEQLSDEAVEAVIVSLYQEKFWALSPEEQASVRSGVRAALAAALAAWPGAWYVDAVDFEAKLILPLTQENNDA